MPIRWNPVGKLIYAQFISETSDPVAQELADLSEKGGVQTVFIGFHSDMPEVIAACADIGVVTADTKADIFNPP